ncbi:DgyrCDS9782 [Dimorphilus gyrociliatus]|uniref:DgyrCDS9782 n=1 Tax=Dimorphilus gyrociliatus TaxID=2664684 RepID=A0A7I8VZN0_9ANNE|nr:DgyrCDS9782 [Dimorphilus gyrociliatus]
MKFTRETDMYMVKRDEKVFSLLTRPLPNIPDNGYRIKIGTCNICLNHPQACFLCTGEIVDVGSNKINDTEHLNSKVVVYTDLWTNEFYQYLSISNKNQLLILPKTLTNDYVTHLPGFLLVFPLIKHLSRRSNVVIIGSSYLTNLILLLIQKYFINIQNASTFYIIDENASRLVNLKKTFKFIQCIHLDKSIYEEYNQERINNMICGNQIDIVISLIFNKYCIDQLRDSNSQIIKEISLCKTYIEQAFMNYSDSLDWLDEHIHEINWPNSDEFSYDKLIDFNLKIIKKETDDIAILKF